jgi:UrcA family protein
MMKNKSFLSGQVMAGALGISLLCAAGAVRAGDYDSSYSRDEAVRVGAPNSQIERRQLVGHVGDDIDATELSTSSMVNYSDLDLSRHSDVIALRDRIRDTAQTLCAELVASDRDLSDQDQDRECVHDATRGAMLKATGGRFG